MREWIASMHRWKRFHYNSAKVLSDLRGLLMEFHALLGMLMLVTLALIEFWNIVTRVANTH
jgi:hypothetical protein